MIQLLCEIINTEPVRHLKKKYFAISSVLKQNVKSCLQLSDQRNCQTHRRLCLCLCIVRAKVTVRKPRVKSAYTIPTSLVKKQFSHFASMRVAPDAIEEVMKV